MTVVMTGQLNYVPLQETTRVIPCGGIGGIQILSMFPTLGRQSLAMQLDDEAPRA